MTIKLNDTQLVLLSSAAQRDDHCLILPGGARVAAARKAVRKLLDAGFVREVRARGNTPVWRRDDETGDTYALKLTAAGAKAIVIDSEAARADAERMAPTDNVASSDGEVGEAPRSAALSVTVANSAELRADPTRTEIATACSAPRQGTKTAGLIAMLSREGGATVDELSAAMGWLHHTTRAALTGLRKRGYVLERLRRNEARACSYRLGAPAKT